MKLKRIISVLLITATILSLPTMANAGNIKDSVRDAVSQTQVNEVKADTQITLTFSDVNQGDWYYDSVMAMTKGGYFAGKGEIVNGVGRFATLDTMTKAEFLTVVARILYDEDNLKAIEGDAWWSVYYTALINGGVITIDEFKVEDMEKPMTRQEMSLVAIRALEQRGETVADAGYAVQAAIPDYQSIGTFYRPSVAKAYQAGILVGVDENGTFDPQGVLDRASATTVLQRIIDSSKRTPKDFTNVIIHTGGSHGSTSSNVATIGQQTIREGEKSKRVPAREGDIFIKADGTQIVLKKGPSGVVGEGQGVAPDIGLFGTNSSDGYLTPGNDYENQLTFIRVDENLKPYFVSADGKSLNNRTYTVNATTGEGHWDADWQIIEATVAKPSYEGTYDGEVSKDAYSLYKWDAMMEMWIGNNE